jgi:membrane protein YdbS with pleckstrin-like domain
MPKHLKATYLADQEYLLEETRATKWYYFPGPVLWVLIFGALSYEGWGAMHSWAGTVTFRNWTGKFASDIHLNAGEFRWILAALFSLLLLVGVLWLFTRWLRWIRTVYAVTNRRVIVQKGILGRNFDEIPVTQVRGVDVHQSFGERLLGYGTIRVSSEGGTRVGNEDWYGIPKPFKFQKLIENATEAVNLPAPAAPPMSR